MTWLTVLTFAKRIPAWAYVALAVIVALAVAYQVGKGNERAEAKLEAAQAQAKATEQARKSDAAASAQIKETTDEVEAGNQRAREADRGDPLGDGLRSLRTEAGKHPPAR